MGFGSTVDAVLGTASRALHLRKTRIDTTRELETFYLDQPLETLFPAPRGVPVVRRERSLKPFGDVTDTLSWTSAHEPLSPSYRARHETDYAINLTAWSRWVHRHGSRRRSLLLYVHGWLEPGSWVEESTLLPLWRRTMQVDTAHVQLPFHGRRSPAGQWIHGEWFWTADLVRSMEAVRQAVIDVRSAIAWYRSIGYEEIGVVGLSLGGCVVMLLGCLPDPPDYIVPMIAHLQLGEAIEEAPILWRMRTDLEAFGLGEAKRRDIFSRVQMSTAMPILPRDRQLWVAAKEDGYLKAELVERQWERWHRPPIVWIPGGHMTFPIGMPRVLRAMAEMPKRAGDARIAV